MNRPDALTLANELKPLLDDDAPAAVARASEAAQLSPDDPAVQFVCAAILIDGGAESSDSSAIDEGVGLLRHTLSKERGHDEFLHRNDTSLRYNLANGLSQLSMVARRREPSVAAWLDAFHAQHVETRNLYFGVINDAADRGLRTQAHCNLGNNLSSVGRWVEAYEHYARALQEDPTNGVAAGAAARSLLWCAQRGLGPKLQLEGLATRYGQMARANLDRVNELGGRRAVEQYADLPTEGSEPPRHEHEVSDDPYTQFVLDNRLALTTSMEGLGHFPGQWDSAHLESVTQPIQDVGVPPIFAMVNTIKADFLVARRLGHAAVGDVDLGKPPPSDTGKYVDTFDGALFGTGCATLVLAQRAATDVLDRVAVALNHYLAVGERPRGIHFRRFFREGSAGRMRPSVAAEIDAGNAPLLALVSLADDFGPAAPFENQQALRHAATHRFLIAHDHTATEPMPASTPEVEHVELDELVREVLYALQGARASILYLIGTVHVREERMAHEQSGTSVLLEAVDHHEMRGAGSGQ